MIRISETELDIMNVIWEKGEATSHEITMALNEKFGENTWSANTVRTLLNRLTNKGALSTRAIGKRIFMYSSTINEVKYKNQLTLELIRKLFHNSLEDFILTYYKSGSIGQEELQEILQKAYDYLLEKEKRKKEENESKTKTES